MKSLLKEQGPGWLSLDGCFQIELAICEELCGAEADVRLFATVLDLFPDAVHHAGRLRRPVMPPARPALETSICAYT